MQQRRLVYLVMIVAALLFQATTLAGSPPPADSDRLAPIPDHGAVPSIVPGVTATAELQAVRADVRRYEQQIKRLRREYLALRRISPRSETGLELMREFTDPAAFQPLVEVLATEADAVGLAVLDHLATLGDAGQGGLAWAAIHAEDPGVRDQATARLTMPASTPVLRVLDTALRSRKHVVANHAAAVAGTIRALETIPLLMFAQSTRDPRPSDEGDLAWIAIETQQAFVANVVPVVGDSSGAFVPVVGVVSEGFVLRVHDAVVIIYRTVVHHVLVSMTSADWGESTAHLGYDMHAWWTWYNETYVPFKNAELREAELAEPPAGS